MAVFEYLVTTPLEWLRLGARDHAFIATQFNSEFAQCLARDKWTCHCCGTWLPGFMEVDHVGNHDWNHLEDIRAICQFCHNLRHPVWAALRGRFRAFWSSGIDQVSINRMAWSALSAEPLCRTIPDNHHALHRLQVSIERRELHLSNVMGSARPDAMFEALLIACQHVGPERVVGTARVLDQCVRFWPVAAERLMHGSARTAASLSTWQDTGFVDVTEEFLDSLSDKVSSPQSMRQAFMFAEGLSGDLVDQPGDGG